MIRLNSISWEKGLESLKNHLMSILWHVLCQSFYFKTFMIRFYVLRFFQLEFFPVESADMLV